MPVGVKGHDPLSVDLELRSRVPVVLPKPLSFLRMDEDQTCPRGLTSSRLLMAVDLASVGLAVGVSTGRYLHAVSFGLLLLFLNGVTGLNRARLTFLVLDDLGPFLMNASVAFSLATTLNVLTGPSRLATTITPLVVYTACAFPL